MGNMVYIGSSPTSSYMKNGEWVGIKKPETDKRVQKMVEYRAGTLQNPGGYGTPVNNPPIASAPVKSVTADYKSTSDIETADSSENKSGLPFNALWLIVPVAAISGFYLLEERLKKRSNNKKEDLPGR